MSESKTKAKRKMIRTAAVHLTTQERMMFGREDENGQLFLGALFPTQSWKQQKRATRERMETVWEILQKVMLDEQERSRVNLRKENGAIKWDSAAELDVEFSEREASEIKRCAREMDKNGQVSFEWLPLLAKIEGMELTEREPEQDQERDEGQENGEQEQ